MFGYDVANGATNTYWASDLLHRLLHIPQLSEGTISHYSDADEYPTVLELAKSDPELAVRNSDTLQYFALEVYAHDIAVPGLGCAGTYTATSTSVTSFSTSTRSGKSSTASSVVASVSTSASSSPVPSSSVATIPTTSKAAEACSAHGDHW